MPIDFELPVSQDILTALSPVDQLKGRWSSGLDIPAERLARLEEAARIRSIAASCRLSGIRISDAEVAGVLRGDTIPAVDDSDVIGYDRALRYPLPGPDQLLTTDSLRRLHAVLAGAVGETVEPSPWRTLTLEREHFDAGGQATGRVFPTLPPRMVEEKTEELVTWLEYEVRAGRRHPVLVAGTFVLAFLAASPFDRYSGRLARLLIGRLLQRAGYGHMRYGSIEVHLEEMRDSYHAALDLGQTRLWSGGGDLTPWLTFLLEVLNRHRQRLESKMDLERRATDYTPLQRTILDAVREHGTVDAGLLLRATHANRNTLKDNLRRLVSRGVLEKTGQRRGTRYRIATPDRLET